MRVYSKFLTFILAWSCACLSLISNGRADQKVLQYEGCISDGYNAYGTYGLYKRTIEFSPDEQSLVYLWSHTSYAFNSDIGSRPNTLTDSLEIRVKRVVGTNELRISLDAVDFRPFGRIYYLLDASLQVAPDSKHAAAICSRRLVLIDLMSKTSRNIEYTNEFFGSFSWRDGKTLCFSTYNKDTLNFWRWDINSPSDSRSNVYQTKTYAFIGMGEQPPHLQRDQWSPNGRFVWFRNIRGTNEWVDNILDLDTLQLKEFPFSLVDQCWKPDSTAMLVNVLEKTNRLLLINPISGQIVDLSMDFQNLEDLDTLDDQTWTPDSKYIINRNKLIQPRPFKVILSVNRSLIWSPIPGWLFLPGRPNCKWINCSGHIDVTIQEHPAEWIWSSKGNYAARIERRNLVIFKPELPSELKR